MPNVFRQNLGLAWIGRNWRGIVVMLGLAAVANGALAESKTAAPKVTVPQRWMAATEDVRDDSMENMSQWWDKLHDATLSGLIERSLRNSPDMRAAEAKLREGRARRQLASSNRRPSLGASGSATRRSSSSSIVGTGAGTYSLGSDIDWDPDVSGAKRNAFRAAQADYRASQADFQKTQLSVAAEVARNYVQLRAYQVRLEIARHNEASQSETLQIVQWREQAGLVGAVDVEQARANRDQTRAQIPSLEANLAQTQHELELLAGLAPGDLSTELAGGAAIPSPPDEVAIGIPADTLRQRPDVRAAEERILAEASRMGQQRAARYPSLNLTGSIGLEVLTGMLTGGTSSLRSLASSFSQTLFDSGRIRQNIEIQSAVQQQAAVNYESTVLTALKEVENALVSFSKSRERLASLTTAADAARKAAALAENRYAAGLVDFQTVLDTQRTVLTLQDSLAATQADRTTAVIQLYQALGGGWPSTGNTSVNSKGN